MPKTNTTNGAERRRWKRVPLDVRVKLLLAEADGVKVIHGRSTVISEGGMGVTLTRELPKGTLATLVFTLPGETQERSMRSQLTYRSGFGCGFEFTEVTAEERRRFRVYCAQEGNKD